MFLFSVDEIGKEDDLRQLFKKFIIHLFLEY